MEKQLGSLLPWQPTFIRAWFDARWIWVAALLPLLYAASGAVSQETGTTLVPDTPPQVTREAGGVVNIQAARQAYWQGRLEDAERLYQALAKQTPDSADALGELGNMYWQQGKQEAAFETYFETATRLYRQKKQQQAWDLLTFVSLAQWLRQDGAAGELLCQQLKNGKTGG